VPRDTPAAIRDAAWAGHSFPPVKSSGQFETRGAKGVLTFLRTRLGDDAVASARARTPASGSGETSRRWLGSGVGRDRPVQRTRLWWHDCEQRSLYNIVQYMFTRSLCGGPGVACGRAPVLRPAGWRARRCDRPRPEAVARTSLRVTRSYRSTTRVDTRGEIRRHTRGLWRQENRCLHKNIQSLS
jgi:hypothetical protein